MDYAFQTESKLYFCLEYCPGGELFFYLSQIGRFKQDAAKFYAANIGNKPTWYTYMGIASCWIAGAAHAIPLLTNWNDECVTDFSTCSLPYKSSPEFRPHDKNLMVASLSKKGSFDKSGRMGC